MLNKILHASFSFCHFWPLLPLMQGETTQVSLSVAIWKHDFVVGRTIQSMGRRSVCRGMALPMGLVDC